MIYLLIVWSITFDVDSVTDPSRCPSESDKNMWDWNSSCLKNSPGMPRFRSVIDSMSTTFTRQVLRGSVSGRERGMGCGRMEEFDETVNIARHALFMSTSQM